MIQRLSVAPGRRWDLLRSHQPDQVQVTAGGQLRVWLPHEYLTGRLSSPDTHAAKVPQPKDIQQLIVDLCKRRKRADSLAGPGRMLRRPRTQHAAERLSRLALS